MEEQQEEGGRAMRKVEGKNEDENKAKLLILIYSILSFICCLSWLFYLLTKY